MTTQGINHLKHFEGCRLKAYQDVAGVWTIGYGATFYEDGTKVKKGDQITKERAEQLLRFHISLFSQSIKPLLPPLKPQQVDALVSFAFNVGVGAFKKSTLLKKVKANPEDPAIELEFLKWVKAGGVVVNGLIKRRQAESDLYFS